MEMKIEPRVWAAICYKHYDNVREILKENKIDPNYMESGKGLMHLIATTLEVDIAEMLLDMGADIDMKDGWGYTPVMRALFEYMQRDYEDDSMIRFLFDKGASKEIPNDDEGANVKEDLAELKAILKIKYPEKLKELDWLD